MTKLNITKKKKLIIKNITKNAELLFFFRRTIS